MQTTKVKWPPDFTKEWQRRETIFKRLRNSRELQASAKAYYAERPIQFICDFGVIYEPRNAMKQAPTLMPFMLFDRQKDFITFVMAALYKGANGLCEKSRDVGATWLSAWLSIYLWAFVPGSSVGWGSKKAKTVDTLGDPGSLFEKLRIGIKYLPYWFLPKGWDSDKHSFYMKIINPETGSTIIGEAGKNIGRGGRTSIYFKDESAHYEHAESIEAALLANTDVQIDISSVNTIGGVFHRKKQSGVVWSKDKDLVKDATNIFIFDWRDHPGKDQKWYDEKRQKSKNEGILHVFAREVDRDYSATSLGIVIPQIWVKAAIDAHKAIGFDCEDDISISGLDVADGGLDMNSHANRKGVILRHCSTWSEVAEDTGETARIAISEAQELGATELQYDSIGVGSGIKAEANRLKKEGVLKESSGLSVVAWNAANDPSDPYDYVIPDDDSSPTNKEFYANLKAQGWWMLRRRFEKTYKAVVKGVKYPYDELISISSELDRLHEITAQLSQPTYSHDGVKKLLINKTPDGMSSPNDGDAIMMCYHPVIEEEILVS